MDIRRMRPGDLADVLVLCREHAAYEGTAFVEQGQAARLAEALAGERPRLFGWVVEAPDGVAGYMTATLEYSTWDARSFVHMDCLYLRAAWRGAGLGRRLLDELQRFAAAQGCVQIQWQTPADNARAIAFYRAVGALDRARRRFCLVVPRPVGPGSDAPASLRAAP